VTENNSHGHQRNQNSNTGDVRFTTVCILSALFSIPLFYIDMIRSKLRKAKPQDGDNVTNRFPAELEDSVPKTV
jgi:hypothetical protein